jgi:hypothetical protein
LELGYRLNDHLEESSFKRGIIWKVRLETNVYSSPSSDGVVRNGAFANITLPTNSEPLIRDYNQTIPSFWTPSQLGDLVVNTLSFSEFNWQLENYPHAIIHIALGGKTGQLRDWRATNDPLFWSHHAFVDYSTSSLSYR